MDNNNLSSTINLPPWFGFRIGTWLSTRLQRMREKMTPPDTRLTDIATSFWQSQALYAAARLKVADCLADGPRDVTSLARELEVDADMLHRLMRYLYDLGVFDRDEAGRYSLNKVSEFLVSTHPQSQRAGVLYVCEDQYLAFNEMVHTMKTGELACWKIFGTSIFDHYAKNERAGRIFNQAMTSFSVPMNQAVAADYDFSNMNTLVDLGGGLGTLMNTILDRYPSLQGVIFEQPHMREAMLNAWEDRPHKERVSFEFGDFFEQIQTAADGYILKQIVHDWPDDKMVELYKAVDRAMLPGGRLLLAEMVIDEEDNLRRLKMGLDLNMMLQFGGKERTVEEHRELLNAAGFQIAKVVPTRSLVTVIEAQRAG